MKHYLAIFAACGFLSAQANVNESEGVAVDEIQAPIVEEVMPGSDQAEPAGLVTGILNGAIERAMPQPAKDDEPMQYGRTVTKWASAPKFGGYAIGKYAYSSKGEGSNTFSARLIRLYVDGTLFKDFKYRLQMEMENQTPGPHVKDFFIAWKHWDELEIKVGQFKRCFTFENPYNPWEVGVGDYSQIVKKLAGFSDYCTDGLTWNGGRDQGIQLQGDVLKIGEGQNRRALFHYMAAVYNGNGINRADNNNQKDVIGSLQVQPIKNLYVGVFGWTGNVTNSGTTVRRERYALGAKYENNGWSARAEYAHHSGTAGSRADGWYATVGVPVTKWLKVYAKYDVFRAGADWNRTQTIYSLCPNFQLHKNLMFQLQYNYGHDKTLAKGKRDYHDLWVETYFRF